MTVLSILLLVFKEGSLVIHCKMKSDIKRQNTQNQAVKHLCPNIPGGSVCPKHILPQKVHRRNHKENYGRSLGESIACHAPIVPSTGPLETGNLTPPSGKRGRIWQTYAVEELQHVEDWINTLPRKILDYKTPQECFDAALKALFSHKFWFCYTLLSDLMLRLRVILC